MTTENGDKTRHRGPQIYVDMATGGSHIHVTPDGLAPPFLRSAPFWMDSASLQLKTTSWKTLSGSGNTASGLTLFHDGCFALSSSKTVLVPSVLVVLTLPWAERTDASKDDKSLIAVFTSSLFIIVCQMILQDCPFWTGGRGYFLLDDPSCKSSGMLSSFESTNLLSRQRVWPLARAYEWGLWRRSGTRIIAALSAIASNTLNSPYPQNERDSSDTNAVPVLSDMTEKMLWHQCTTSWYILFTKSVKVRPSTDSLQQKLGLLSGTNGGSS